MWSNSCVVKKQPGTVTLTMNKVSVPGGKKVLDMAHWHCCTEADVSRTLTLLVGETILQEKEEIPEFLETLKFNLIQFNQRELKVVKGFEAPWDSVAGNPLMASSTNTFRLSGSKKHFQTFEIYSVCRKEKASAKKRKRPKNTPQKWNESDTRSVVGNTEFSPKERKENTNLNQDDISFNLPNSFCFVPKKFFTLLFTVVSFNDWNTSRAHYCLWSTKIDNIGISHKHGYTCTWGAGQTNNTRNLLFEKMFYRLATSQTLLIKQFSHASSKRCFWIF